MIRMFTYPTFPLLRIRTFVAIAVAAACYFVSPDMAQADATLAISDEQLITVELNKGAMLKLSASAASVVIADPEIADIQVVSPKVVVVRGKRVGETSFYAIDAMENPIVLATVKVTHNLSSLNRAINRVAPDADIEIKTVDGGLLIDGYAGTTAESESIRNLASTFIGKNDKMVNMIKTGGSDQVMVKVKFVEMARNDLKRIGFNVSQISNGNNTSFQFLQGRDLLFRTADPNIQAYRSFGSTLTRSISNESNVLFRFDDFAGLIDALEVDGLATTLAEPSLVTTTGEQASFLAGGQFPLPLVGQNGQVTLEYKPFGVSLKFKPTVLSKERISMTVEPEVSTLNFSNPISISGITYPILDTRKANATIELGSGDSFMLAGLMQHSTSNNVNKFPGMGDLPILGALFRSTEFQNNQTELVILVTPYIVHPVSHKKMQVPTDGHKPATDFERVVMGDLYTQEEMDESPKRAPDPINTGNPSLNGEGGFMME